MTEDNSEPIEAASPESAAAPLPGTGAAAMEVAAVLLLVIGGLAFLPAWVAGVVLLWASPRWRRNDRLLGTLIWPGGLAVFRRLLLRHLAVGPGFWSGSMLPMRHMRYSVLVLAQPHPIVRWLLLAVLAVPPVLVAIRLLRRARPPESR